LCARKIGLGRQRDFARSVLNLLMLSVEEIAEICCSALNWRHPKLRSNGP
jgi:hypothetical protein